MDLQAKIRSLPTSAGVYLYKNSEGEVIYVGKAINLRELNARVPKEVLGSIRGVIDVLQEVKEALGVS